MTPTWKTLRPCLVCPGMGSARQAENLLPVELWDLILSLVANEELLRVAYLAIALYLRRNNIDLFAGVLTLHPHTLALTALHLSRVQLQFSTLSCRFLRVEVDRPRGMRNLSAVIEKCPDLTDLYITWPTQKVDKILTTAIRDSHAFHAMSKKTPGPVIVVGLNKSIYRYVAADLSTQNWTLAHLRHAPPFSALITVQELQRIKEVHSGSLKCFTLIDFDTRSLALGPTGMLSAADLSAILPHLRLPSLRWLGLNTNTIHPAALSQFLSHHPRLASIQSRGAYGAPLMPTRLL
ncbi:hypothetical protein GGX14DRAFT_427667 [Mycena pura]|uniref:Uncharacterized protein n=1 Tax=Mycena pura TaxID=153505 RepID=A0AAD6YM87_9AGAR|nr:hypothetical protein GGX14DRAFT_427667 [Mycena pura]